MNATSPAPLHTRAPGAANATSYSHPLHLCQHPSKNSTSGQSGFLPDNAVRATTKGLDGQIPTVNVEHRAHDLERAIAVHDSHALTPLIVAVQRAGGQHLSDDDERQLRSRANPAKPAAAAKMQR